MGQKLDLKDKRILFELNKDSREQFSKIAKRTGLSKQAVGYRIQGMIKAGLVKGFSSVINSSLLGLMGFHLFVKFQNISDEQQKELTDFLTLNPLVFSFAFGGGQFDFVAELLVKNVGEFERFFDEINYKFGKLFASHSVSISTKTHHLGINYLFKDEGEFKDIIRSEIIQAAIPKGRIFFWDLLPRKEDFSGFQEYMVEEMKIIDKGVNLEEFIDDSFAKKAYDVIGHQWREREWKRAKKSRN